MGMTSVQLVPWDPAQTCQWKTQGRGSRGSELQHYYVTTALRVKLVYNAICSTALSVLSPWIKILLELWLLMD